MAVHDDYPGVTVQVIVNGEPLEEYTYEDEEQLPKTTTRYIEAQSGAEFCIKSKFTQPFIPKHVSIQTYLDGTLMDDAIAPRERLLQEEGHIQTDTTWRAGKKWFKSNFCFSPLEIAQDDDQEMAAERLESQESLGVITLSMYRVIRMRKRQDSNDTKVELQQIGPLSKRKMKDDLRSHQAILKPMEKARKVDNYQTDKELEPFVTFRFKYRSIASLKWMGLIPYSPDTDPSSPPTRVPKLELELDQSAEISGNTCQVSDSRPGTVDATTVSPQQTVTPPFEKEDDSLTIEEIIAMISGHRGHDKDLATKNRKSLLALLNYYERKDPENATGQQDPVVSDGIAIKQEPDANGRSIARIKREADEADTMHEKKKRRKTEVIVIDD